MIADYISASNDRVEYQALKHLIVSGNALIFMGKDGLKLSATKDKVDRDGNGNVIEIVTKEMISRKGLGLAPAKPNEEVNDKYGATEDDAEVYTCVRMDESSGNWKWHRKWTIRSYRVA